MDAEFTRDLLMTAVIVTMAFARSELQPSFIAGAQAGTILLVFAGIAVVTWLTAGSVV